MTWPLPWWVAVVPAVVVAVVSFVYVNQASTWAYVAPAQLSGMLRESVTYAGPLVCICAGWVAERFTNRHSPLSWSTLPRSSGAQGLRILGVVTAAWVTGQLAGGIPAIIVQAGRATGGTLYLVEIPLAAAGLAFFIVTGFLIGAVTSRWHAPLLAAGWSSFCVAILPLYYSDVVPDSGRNTEYYLFPALTASDHRDLDVVTMSTVVVWWLLVLVSLVVATRGWYRARARGDDRALMAPGAAVAVICSLGLLLPHVTPSAFVDGDEDALACTGAEGLDVCVLAEQEPLLGQIVAGIGPVTRRMGEHFPAEVTAVFSYRAVPAALAEGYRPGEFLAVNAGISGAESVDLDLAMSLAGISSCEADRSDQRALRWAFVLGEWISGGSDTEWSDDPLARGLAARSDAEILDWYSRHSSSILSCTYVGSGPA